MKTPGFNYLKKFDFFKPLICLPMQQEKNRSSTFKFSIKSENI